MFKGHPKGLIAAALANMGERFGFYTMMAILVLFLQSKFNLDGANAGIIYSVFYFSIYILALVGGIIADKINNFKGTILVGLVMMALGYVILAIPTPTPVSSVPVYLTISLVGLFVIAFGNGLFKGNLQALVGQMYDKPEYEKMRDSGFSLFYAFINVGAIFAPIAAIYMREWWLGKNGVSYDANLPEYCHSFIDGNITESSMVTFQQYADKANGAPVADLAEFANRYLDVFNTGFHYAFGTAIVAMAISMGFFPLKVLNGLNVVGFFRAGGDTKFSFAVEASTLWFLGVPLAAFGGLVLKLSFPEVLLLTMVDEAVKGIILLIRYKSRKWIKNVIEGL